MAGLPVRGTQAGCLSLLLALLAAGGGRGAEPEREPAIQRIYPFLELLAQAELIIVAELGETRENVARLKVAECFKARDLEAVAAADDAEGRKAAKLLEDLARTEAGKEPVVFVPAGRLPAIELLLPAERKVPAPKRGERALFFLWDRQPGPAGVWRYHLAHPQNYYEPEKAAEVKVALGNPKSVLVPRWLRPWDLKMSHLLERRRQDMHLRQLPAGHQEKGMKLSAQLRAAPKIENSLAFSLKIQNAGAEEAMVCDSLAAVGLRLRKAGAAAGEALLLRAGEQQALAGVDVEGLFSLGPEGLVVLPAKDEWLMSARFGAQDFPALKDLQGEYTANLFYRLPPAQPIGGRKLWQGVVISEDLKVTFPRRDAEKKPEEQSREK